MRISLKVPKTGKRFNLKPPPTSAASFTIEEEESKDVGIGASKKISDSISFLTRKPVGEGSDNKGNTEISDNEVSFCLNLFPDGYSIEQPMESESRHQTSVDVPKFSVVWPEFGSFAMTLMKDGGDSIQIPCDEVVFGYEKIIYVLHENVLALLKFEMVGQAVISAYMMHLYTEIRETEEWDTFGFFNPGLTFNLNEGFESYVVKRLREVNDRTYFMPHNSKGNKMPKVKHLLGSPKQPGGHECGYVVMRYMKDIIADKELTFLKKWSEESKQLQHGGSGGGASIGSRYIEEHT
ncbi:hypothetical protein OROHE_004751 [Orobanche hederae]